MSIISARDLTKAYGEKTLFSGISLSVSAGDRVGLVGINGTGKSTLLKVLAGDEAYDSGVLERQRDARIMYLAQEPQFLAHMSAQAVVEEGLGPWFLAKQ